MDLDGTGMEAKGMKGKQASSAFEDAAPKGAGAEAGQGEGGRGPELAKSANRSSDVRGGMKKK